MSIRVNLQPLQPRRMFYSDLRRGTFYLDEEGQLCIKLNDDVALYFNELSGVFESAREDGQESTPVNVEITVRHR